jgi:hypothetical protein
MFIRWRHALLIGFSIALAHRLFLMAWLPLAWAILSASIPNADPDFHTTADARLPAFTAQDEARLLGVWRRWDGTHYLSLAHSGYRTDNTGSTVFGVLTPLAIRAAAPLVGGSPDLASIIVQTLAFGAALTLLIVVCERYFDDRGLGIAAAVTTTLLPLSFYFAAPFSESLYLACALGVFAAGLSGRWLIAALCGLLAALTRAQGAIIALPAGLLLLEARGWQLRQPARWLAIARRAFVPGLALLLIPMGYVVFVLYRDSIGLPPLGDTYARFSYHFFVNPLEGMLINARWIVENPAAALVNQDIWLMMGALGMTAVTLIVPRHRKLPLLAFTIGHLLVYFSKINWVWGGTDEVLFSQSFARYTLVLFPLVIALADGARRLPRLGQAVLGGGALLLLMYASALYTMALVGP